MNAMHQESSQVSSAFRHGVLAGLFDDKRDDYYDPKPQILTLPRGREWDCHYFLEEPPILVSDLTGTVPKSVKIQHCAMWIDRGELRAFPHWKYFPCKCRRVIWRIER